MIAKYLVQKCLHNRNWMNEMFIGCLIVKQQFPPIKNENKFIYGIVCQKIIFNYFEKFLVDCRDLDKDEQNCYKNDFSFLMGEDVIPCSIKVISKRSNIILINKNHQNINHDLDNLITVLVILETCEVIVIEHNTVDKKYIINGGSNISYRSSLITYMRKNKLECVFKLEPDDKFNNFKTNRLNRVNVIDYYTIIAENVLRQI